MPIAAPNQSQQADGPGAGRPGVLRAVEDRVLWLSTAIIDHANRVRPNPSGLKVGGHQASSASMVSIMTSLWFEHLRAGNRVPSNRMPRRCCMRSITCSVASTSRT